MSDPVLVLKDVRRTFEQGGNRLDILKGVDLAVHPGEIVALLGPSGAGKSTLLHVAGLLEPATAGEIIIAGRAAHGLDDAARTAIRSHAIGFVYQFHHLLPEFSALENVMMPALIAGVGRGAAGARARELLTGLGLAQRLDHRPARLSGGEQQRVAIARALMNQPSLLLADEPTGNLDGATSEVVFAEILDLARSGNVGALIATHNVELARRMDRVVTLKDGRLVSN